MPHPVLSCHLGGGMTQVPAREPCPWLPAVEGPLGPEVTRALGEKDASFYVAALGYSQSLWLEGKPAQAILQLNKAWMADLTSREEILLLNPAPYRALRWIIRRAKDGSHGFMGNPVRHFQHLASRMSGPRAEIRSWRAWACFHLASCELDWAAFPPDGVQIAREGLWIPAKNRVCAEIARSGWFRELKQLFLSLED